VNFIHSIFYCHPTLSNEAYFQVIRRFILSNLDRFNKFQLIKILDIYKYNQVFMNETHSQRLKALLESQLESKQNDKLNDSEEEELKMLEKPSTN
jgi:hypothetical protein